MDASSADAQDLRIEAFEVRQMQEVSGRTTMPISTSQRNGSIRQSFTIS